MIVLGIDHATRTAYSVIEDGKCIETGFVIYDKDNRSLLRYYEKLSKIIKRIKPDVVALEEPKSIRNANVTKYLVALYTLCKLACENNNIFYFECNVKVVKKFITGNGNATKEDVYTALCSKYHIESKYIYKVQYYKTKPNMIKQQYFDECDATALALYIYYDKI